MPSGGTRAVGALVALFVGFGAACGHPAPVTSVGSGLTLPPTTTPAPAVVAAPPAPPAPAAQPRPAVAARRVATSVSVKAPVADGRIVIPKIGLDLPTYEGVDPWTLRFGPSHWEMTAEPGQPGNTTFAGHRTTFTHPFHDIDQLAVGDDVIFATAQGVFTYRVTESFVVNDFDSWIADPTETPTFTLFACHPMGSERERFVVKGELVTDAT